MALPLIPQKTVRYKTHLKRALVEAMRSVFENHPDPDLKDAQVTIDFPQIQADFPSVIVRFFERSISNAGVGHVEWIKGAGASQAESWTRFKHYIYKGDVEFQIQALSSLDRDLMADTVVQTLAVGNIEGWTNRFFERIYDQTLEEDPYSLYHYVNIDTDTIQGFGENQTQAPWGAEDVLIYQTSYRCGVLGEFYSLPPDEAYPMLEKVDVFPWIDGLEPQPQGAEDPAPWMDAADDFNRGQN